MKKTLVLVFALAFILALAYSPPLGAQANELNDETIDVSALPQIATEHSPQPADSPPNLAFARISTDSRTNVYHRAIWTRWADKPPATYETSWRYEVRLPNSRARPQVKTPATNVMKKHMVLMV